MYSQSVYNWVRRTKRAANQALSIVQLDSLVIPKLKKKKAATAFSIFLKGHPEKPAGSMNTEGKSVIGEWMRNAKQAFNDLPEEEKIRLGDLADEENTAREEAELSEQQEEAVRGA